MQTLSTTSESASWLFTLNSKTSIGNFDPKVKSPGPRTFQLPKVLAVQQSDSPRRVFLYLYAISDQDSIFELDAAKISEHTGLSRKTIYKVIELLQKVHLLFLIERRTGRGRHSVYRLNWRKPVKKCESVEQKKCHPPIRYNIKLNNIHPSGDSPKAMPGDIISPEANRQLWDRCLRAHRLLLGQSLLSKAQQRLAACMIGKYLKGKTRNFALQVYGKLKAIISRLKPPEWVKSFQELCRWFMGVLRGLFKPKPKPKRKRFEDYNEYLWHLHQQEVERVMRKRVEYQPEERSVAERWADWAKKRLEELAWRKKQAELARQAVRAASTGLRNAPEF